MRKLILAVSAVTMLVAASCGSSSKLADAQASRPVSSPTPSAADENPNEPKNALGEKAVLEMLREYLRLYDNGDYIHASAFLSSHVEADCGGPTNLAFALSENHRIEGINYDVRSVSAWGPDDPTMADVTTVESYGGDSYELDLGLAFVFERGDWRLDDLYPLGAGAFCE